MNKLWYTLFFAFYILVLFMFKPRQDVVFAAINETQYIRLFENGNEFELCVKDENYYRVLDKMHETSFGTVYVMSSPNPMFNHLLESS